MNTAASVDFVHAFPPTVIEQLPPRRRGDAINQALLDSKQWLAVVSKGTNPAPLVEFKLWAAAVAEMAKRKNLSGQVQLDALEMLRRAERGLGLTIRHGQEAGEIRKRADRVNPKNQWGPIMGKPGENRITKVSPYAFASADELTGNGAGIYHLTDDTTHEQFEEALAEARKEHNLTRASVVRKIRELKQKPEPEPAPAEAVRPILEKMPRSLRAKKIRELANHGYTSRQMAEMFGMNDERVRGIARQFNVDIPADRVTAKTLHIDPTRIVEETTNTLQGIDFGLGLLTSADYDTFTRDQVKSWLRALEEPAGAIRSLLRELNKRAR